jgi:predicted nucleic acid-binding protein
MKPRVFLDTNIFIFAFEFPESNSGKIIDLLNQGKIEAVISQRVFKEIVNYFRKYYNKELADKFRRYILQSCSLVLEYDIKDSMAMLKNEIKEKDLEQIATVKKFGLKYLVSLDRHFEKFEEYITPKEFIKILGIKENKSEY